jgi:hypothetical protein
MRRKGHWGEIYTDFNGEGFFPIPAFSIHIVRRGFEKRGPWVFVTFGAVFGNRGVYLTYYRGQYPTGGRA